MKNVTDKQKRGFADSLYHLLMTSPETGRRLGFYQVGNAPNGNLRIGIGTPDGQEFWILDVAFSESTEIEVKSIKSEVEHRPSGASLTPCSNSPMSIKIDEVPDHGPSRFIGVMHSPSDGCIEAMKEGKAEITPLWGTGPNEDKTLIRLEIIWNRDPSYPSN